MKQKKIPLRTCVITKEKLPKKELIRIVKDNLGNVSIDESGKMNGRGAYLKRDIAVIEQAQKNRMLDKHLETKISDEVFEQLKKMI
jgi:predicted RNA-binding protein YlxR (DUF448 family)